MVNDKQPDSEPSNATIRAIHLHEDDKTVAIRRAMKTVVDVNFEDEPLVDIVAHVLQLADHNLPFYTNDNALRDEGIAMDVGNASLKLRQQPIEEVLSLLLREFNLTWTVRNESVEITTENDYDESRAVALLDVSTLLESDVNGEPNLVDAESLMDVLSSTTRPETWDMLGGVGSLEFFAQRNVLVVANSKKVIQDVEAQLNMLKKVAGHPQAPARPAADEVLQRAYTLRKSFQNAAEADKLVEHLHDLLLESDNELDGDRFWAKVVGKNLLVSHRRDVHPPLSRLLAKLDVIDLHTAHSGGEGHVFDHHSGN